MLQIHLCLVDAECAGFKQFKHKGIASANGGLTPLWPPRASAMPQVQSEATPCRGYRSQTIATIQ